MMTLEEAIEHCEEKACGSRECAKEHRQLAEWLKELQALKTNNINNCKEIEERYPLCINCCELKQQECAGFAVIIGNTKVLSSRKRLMTQKCAS